MFKARRVNLSYMYNWCIFYVPVDREHVTAWRNYKKVRRSRVVFLVIFISTRMSRELFKTISNFLFYKTLDASQLGGIPICGLNESNLSTRKYYPYREINSSLMPSVSLISSLPEYHEPGFINSFYLYT